MALRDLSTFTTALQAGCRSEMGQRLTLCSQDTQQNFPLPFCLLHPPQHQQHRLLGPVNIAAYDFLSIGLFLIKHGASPSIENNI